MDERFSEPETNVITSSQGFSVEVLGRTGLRYTEGARSAWIDSEVLARPKAIAISKVSVAKLKSPLMARCRSPLVAK
jgi:hypothetical protein